MSFTLILFVSFVGPCKVILKIVYTCMCVCVTPKAMASGNGYTYVMQASSEQVV